LLNQLLGKVAPLKLRSGSRMVRFISWGTVLGLVVSLILWLGLDNPRWMVPIRIGEFWQATMLSFEHAGLNWLIRTWVLFGFIAAGLVVANLWCRVACPTGGLLELLKRFSLFKVYKTPECTDCDKCREVCEMGTRPAEPNCTNCTDCVGQCPVNVIKIGRGR
jgi:polyferredoxin